jgi:hypothetical protein
MDLNRFGSMCLGHKPVSIISCEPVPQSILDLLPRLYRSYSRHVSVDKLQALAIRRLGTLVGSSDCLLIVVRHRGRMQGFACWRTLSEESRLLGRAVAHVEMMIAEGDYMASRQILAELVGRVLTSCREHDITYLTARISADELATIHTLEEAGFQIIKRNVTLSLQPGIPAPMTERGTYKTRLSSEKDFDEILKITRTGSSADWFHCDPALCRGVSDRLAEVFTLNCCRSADAVLVASSCGSIQAYASCKIDADTSSIVGIGCGSISSLGWYRHPEQDVSSFIENAALAWLSQHDVQIAEMTSEKQCPAEDRSGEDNWSYITGVNLVLRKLLG